MPCVCPRWQAPVFQGYKNVIDEGIRLVRPWAALTQPLTMGIDPKFNGPSLHLFALVLPHLS